MTSRYSPIGGTSESLEDLNSWWLSGELFETREEEYYGVREMSYNLSKISPNIVPVEMEIETKQSVPPDTARSNDVLVPTSDCPKSDPLTEDDSSSSYSETGSRSDSKSSSGDSRSKTNGSVETMRNSWDEEHDRSSSLLIQSHKDRERNRIDPMKFETVTVATHDMKHSPESYFPNKSAAQHSLSLQEQVKKDQGFDIEGTNPYGLALVSATSTDNINDNGKSYQLQIKYADEGQQLLDSLEPLELQREVPNGVKISADRQISINSNNGSLQDTNDDLPSHMQPGPAFPDLQQYQHYPEFKWYIKCGFKYDAETELCTHFGQDFTPSSSHIEIRDPPQIVYTLLATSSLSNMNLPVQSAVPSSLVSPVLPQLIRTVAEDKNYMAAEPGLLSLGNSPHPQTAVTNDYDICGGQGQRQSQGEHTVLNPEFPLPLPLDSEADVAELDNFLGRTSANKVYFVEKLAKTGGSNTASVTRRVMAKLLTNSVALKYNWAGRQNKIGFGKLKNICNAIFESVEKKYTLSTELEVENKIKEWLKSATSRVQNEIKKLK